VTREDIEAIALALPAATRVVQWGDHDVYKVGGKVFAVAGDSGLSFKVTDIGFLVLTEGGLGKQAAYMAKGQWVTVGYEEAQREDVRGWLATSHSLISAKLTKKARLELGLS
jgi:predicted DNA-binding protein (MmcQ/YjbR family)